MHTKAQELNLNDISILFPLPTADQKDLLISISQVADKGPLIPIEFYKKIPQLLETQTNEAIYNDFKVVAVRVDPCFMEGTLVRRCRPQIRMVWQPVVVNPNNNKVVTADVSLHSFYELNPDEFSTLINSLKELKLQTASQNKGLALQVNPALKEKGLNSEYYNQFKKNIFKFIGQENLSRITFMFLRQNETFWVFGGADITNGEFNFFKIPRVGSKVQGFKNDFQVSDGNKFLGGVSPAPNIDLGDNFTVLLQNTDEVAGLSEEEITEAVRATYRAENPAVHNPGTMDCVSCHMAQAARLVTLAQFPNMNLEFKLQDEIFKSEDNLENISPMKKKTQVSRAFGYFLDQAVVSQRTINESAESARVINQNYNLK